MENFFYEHPKLKSILEIVIGIIVGIAILFFIWIISRPIRADFSRKQDILNFLNNKSKNNISEETIKEYNNLKELTITNETWDISPVIFDYLNKVEKASQDIRLHGNRHEKNIFYIETKIKDSPNENLLYDYLGDDCSFLLYTIPEREVNLHDNNTFMQDLIKQLELTFEHKTDFTNTDWYITNELAEQKGEKVSDNQYILALPYNCWANYKSTGTTNLNRTYTDVEVGEPDKNGYKLKLTYTDNDTGETHTINTYLQFNNKTWYHKKDMTIGLYNTVFKYQKAEFNIYSDLQEK